jgi:hypothetical protein
MRTSDMAMLTFCGLTLMAAGCSSPPHYRVVNPTTGQEYYTTKVTDAGKGGAVKIKDARTGSTVTLQSSDIKEISEGEYNAAIAATPKAQPASAQPAAQPTAVQPAQAEPIQK